MTVKIKYEVVTDTREQKPLWTDTKRYKLDFGDYSIVGHEQHFAIERKSLADLYGTLIGGHERFKQELKRSSVARYFCVVIEGSYTKMLNKDYPGGVYSKLPGSRVTDIVNTLRVKYGIQIIFTTGRMESKRVIKDLMMAYMRVVAGGHYAEESD